MHVRHLHTYELLLHTVLMRVDPIFFASKYSNLLNNKFASVSINSAVFVIQNKTVLIPYTKAYFPPYHFLGHFISED